MNQEAKDFVNKIYQPLGYLKCGVNSDEMWEWAKERSKEQIELMKKEIPMYLGEINPKWLYWDNMLSEINKLP
jgi:hypothetical protein